MADLLILLRTARWAPVLTLLGLATVLVLRSKEPAEGVGALVVVAPAAVTWLLDDPAAVVTACARYGRRTQLAVRCGVAAALAFASWFGVAALAGGAPENAFAILVALLVVALAAGITWGASAGGPAALIAYAASQVPPSGWDVTGWWWWPFAAVAACWLVVAARDPARR